MVGLTDDQAEYYNVAKQFADKELFPNAAKWDEEHHFPLDTFKQLGDLGFGGMFVRDDVGGSALTRFIYCNATVFIILLDLTLLSL